MKRKATKIILAALLSCLVLSACASTEGAPQQTKTDGEETMAGTDNQTGYKKISMEEALEKMKGQKEIVLLDVRTEQEYVDGHIPGATNIPNETIAGERMDTLPEDLNTEILVYCRSGVRSQEAADKLVAMGYTNIVDIGGIQDWTKNIVTGNEPGTLGDVKESLFGEFDAKTLDGGDVDQTIFEQADLTMVNVWATFCGPCISEMPELGKIHEKYKEENVQVVGVVMDVFAMDGSISEDQIHTAKEIVEKTSAGYTHIIPNEALIWARLKDVTAVPQTYFVDKEGNIVGDSYMGARNGQQWEQIINELLKDVKLADAEA